jgi:hypothetical protein
LADALLTGIVSQRSLQNLPLESSCVIVPITENYSTSKLLNVSPEKSHILSCDTVVANERYIDTNITNIPVVIHGAVMFPTVYYVTIKTCVSELDPKLQMLHKNSLDPHVS